jgi:hypothetical protein
MYSVGSTLKEFVGYVMDFYGKGGLYDMGVKEKDLWKAIEDLVAYWGIKTFEGDSIDRERVRDILISKYGYKFPE